MKMARFLSMTTKILKHIFSFLSLSDMKNLLLVSTYIQKTANDPKLWTNAKFTKPKKIHEILCCLGYHRFSMISYLDLSGFNLELYERNYINLLLKYLKNDSNLKSINLSGNDLSMLPAIPFCAEVSRCEQINLSKSNLNMEQVVLILENISESKYAREVDLSSNDLKFVKGSLLRKSLKKLTKINLSKCNLSKILDDQIEEILESLTSSNIKEIDLSGSNMMRVNFDSIGLDQSLSSLNLCDVSFHPDKINYIFVNLSLVKNLSYLDLSNSILAEAEPILLSDAVIRVFHVNMSFCSLTSKHVEFILNAISKETKIQQLLISGNKCTRIDQDSIINALNHLELFQF